MNADPIKSEPCRIHPEVNKEVNRGYWLEVLKTPIEETRNKHLFEIKKHIQDNYPKQYGLPTTREALICCLMARTRSGCVLGRGDPGTLTRCQENLNSYNVAVGALAPSELYVSNISTAYDNVCVVLARRYFIRRSPFDLDYLFE
jgi:hypothetical protein